MPVRLELTTVPLAANLASHGDRPALLTGGRVLSYRELAHRVDAYAARLGTTRRLVVLVADNSVESLVAYLGALASGHPLILAPAGNDAALKSLITSYDPDVVIRAGASLQGMVSGTHEEAALEEVRPGTRHELHPDLALMLSTSGSTGSPKLVRLSHDNVQSNAEAIADYLNIGAGDRAMTTLAMYYCYGLSVINSHLLRGAGIVLTELSVVDPCFWELFRYRRATSFAAVPYTFELLDRVRFTDMELPSLRYITQAGGRLDPETIVRYSKEGRQGGWDLFVMYGQTEATARMAYLPPHLAAAYATSIGIPVPGGNFRIEPVPGLDYGELVYTGPNVMLGYAEGPADLATGRSINELRTGDLARQQDSGLYEVVGRRSRFVKIVGLRIDLGQVEKTLHQLGLQAACTGTDQKLVAAVEGSQDERLLAKTLAQSLGLPRAAVEVRGVERLPRLATGKTDYPAILELAASPAVPGSRMSEPAAGPSGTPDDVRLIFAEALEIRDIDDGDTFVSLGGDSLSYVAASVRLEKALGHLPSDWHVTPVEDLAGKGRPARKRGRLFAPLETGIVLRALAIVVIISTHVDLIAWPGTAHVLIALAGYNFARFQLGGDRIPRLKRQARSLARVVLPTVAFIGAVVLLTDRFHYTPANLLLLNTIIGPSGWTDAWHFWFVEVLVYVLLAMMALLAIPWADRAEKRFPLSFPVTLIGVGLLARYNLVPFDILHTRPVLWLFALGWALARARTVPQRLVLSAIAALTLPGYFDNPWREATILAGILLLAWLPALPMPAIIHGLVGTLASASLYAYVTHWVVFPEIKENAPVFAVVLSLAVGVAYWAVSMKVMNGLPRLTTMKPLRKEQDHKRRAEADPARGSRS